MGRRAPIPILPAPLLLAALLLAPAEAATLEQVLQAMDAASAAFQSLTARIRIVKHTEIVKDETVDEGTIWVKRVKPRLSRLLIEFSAPDRYYLTVTDKKAEVYRPKIGTVEEYDVSRFRELANQFWLLSFGTAGSDLTARYQVQWKAPEAVAGQPAVRLELIPKSPEMLQHVPRIEMWISTAHWQPLQQKFYEITPGDFRLYTYTEVKLLPLLPDSRVRLQLPSGVKRIQPQR